MPRINYSQLISIYENMSDALNFLGMFPKVVTELRVVPEHQAALNTNHPDATIFVTFKNSSYTRDFTSIFESPGEMGLPVNLRRSSSGYTRSLNMAVDTSHPICDAERVFCAMQQFDYLMKCTDLEDSLLNKSINLPEDFEAQWDGFRACIKQASTDRDLQAVFQQVTDYYMTCKAASAPCSRSGSAQAVLTNVAASSSSEIDPLSLPQQKFSIEK